MPSASFPHTALRRPVAAKAARFAAAAFALAGVPLAAHAQKTPPVTPPAGIVQTAAVPAAKPDAAVAAGRDEAFFGVYLQNAKVGSFVFVRDTKAVLPGTNRAAVRTDAKTILDLRVMGANANQVIESVTWSEPKTGKTLREETKSTVSGRESRVSATYSDRSVTYEADVQGEKKSGTLTLAPGEQFLSDPQNGGGEFLPKVGMSIKGKVFTSDLLRLVDSEATVVGEETITVNNQAISAFKVLDKNPVGPSTMYLNNVGDLLRLDTLLGMQMRREPKEIALAPASDKTASPDLMSIVGIKPSGRRLDDARKLQTATYSLQNVTRSLPPENSVQKATYSLAAPGGINMVSQTATVTVTTQQLPTGKTAPLFARSNDAPEALRPFLQASLYVPTGDPEFVALARRVIGRETETGKAARKIADYVHKTIVPDPTIPVLRTARDILHEPRGVCRDYTTLFTALARSAGLPTKQCTGVVYASGVFLYHAWPEVWVGTNAQTGQDRWVALEPTWGKPWADATHIKLAEGEITDVYNVAADVGQYQISVLQTSTKAVSQP